MGNPEIKVLIEEISKLRSEIIEMKIEIEGLKADITAIGEMSKAGLELKVVGENSIHSNGKFTLIKNKRTNKPAKKEKKVEFEQEKKIIKSDDSVTYKKETFESEEEKVEKAKIDEMKKVNLVDLKIDKKDVKLFREKLKDIMKSEVRYDTWLKTGVENLSRTSKTDFIFPAANDFTRGIVEVRYKEMVFEVLKDIFKNVSSVKIVELYK